MEYCTVITQCTNITNTVVFQTQLYVSKGILFRIAPRRYNVCFGRRKIAEIYSILYFIP